MQNYKITITPFAYNDLESIRDYIKHSLNSPLTSKKLLEEIYNVVSSLETLPERYQRIENEPWHSKGVRKVNVKNYNIYYLIDQINFEVYIIAVFYTGKDQNRALVNRI